MNPLLSGLLAIFMWALLALFTAASGAIPPFQLLAITFGIATLVGLVNWLFRPPPKTLWNLSPKVWLTGTAGLFGYHFFYYSALQNAPVAEASLIAYLWPLLIVIFSALLPGERLRWFHVAGGIIGLIGAVVLLSARAGGELRFSGNGFGYASAVACALIWSSYSVYSRSMRAVPTDAVVGYCLGTTCFALLAHLLTETTTWPDNLQQWTAIIALGLFPVGIAFYAWDHAMKHGPIQLLGSASYAAPVLSTIILVGVGMAEATWQLSFAAISVTFGALLASGHLPIGRSHA